MDINYFKAIHNSTGAKSRKDSILFEQKRAINYSFNKNPDYEPDTLFNGVLKECQVIDINGKTNCKTVKTRPDDTFNVGDMVDYAGEKWLVTDVDLKKQVLTTGTMYVCNYILKFQDNAGNVLSYPVVIDSKITPVLDDNKQVVTAEKKYSIQIVCDDITKHFIYDKRFLIDFGDVEQPEAYKITGRNIVHSTGNGGKLTWTLTWCEFNPQTDNTDLMVADYVSPVETDNTLDINYLGNAEIVVGGAAKTFTAQTEEEVTWQITSLIDELQTTIDENQVTIKCPFDAKYIGMSVKIVAQTESAYGEILLNAVAMV